MRLQTHTTCTLTMPDITEVTPDEVHRLERLAAIYDGHAETEHWDSGSMTIADPTPFRDGSFQDGRTIVRMEQPVFNLGTRQFTITREMATTWVDVRLAPGIDASLIEAGDAVTFVPGGDTRVVTAVIVDAVP